MALKVRYTQFVYLDVHGILRIMPTWTFLIMLFVCFTKPIHYMRVYLVYSALFQTFQTAHKPVNHYIKDKGALEPTDSITIKAQKFQKSTKYSDMKANFSGTETIAKMES